MAVLWQDKEVQCFEDTNKPKQCFHQSICSLGMDEDLEDNLLGPERSEEAKAAWAQYDPLACSSALPRGHVNWFNILDVIFLSYY